ncbi:UDP-3-O-(3-hydroxymyristoyl)glucosamine N-acyltransferase [Limnohabitans sp. 2KL-17]|uniref:UDP-3-O-(3-hydroxymyristoyl)glucosamine N-acyltransferase n=1 Tax=Limnohabitans sp. 2KL-17 TaxID=1100704 RepID=UPI000D3A5D6E|nr:UDP-3-O-(3-hydroxymyristoyl)glucosamine N-acyltransferase [Limnohabitans sp. 2KL-17]PUE62703.1 UDP-3-O-(3-hydroxymyristoyl)glucosamine N-acyltransferase [Limnohabitans sp. 2KL-17]
MSLTLGAIVEALGGRLLGPSTMQVSGLAPLQNAQPDQISFLSQARYQSQLTESLAGCVIVDPAFEGQVSNRLAAIITEDPYLYFARLTQLWKRAHHKAESPRIHPSAVISPDALIAADAVIGPLCVIERGAVVGSGTVLKSRVTVGEDCKIGARCLVHSGVVIGADGFGFAPHQGEWEKIEQLGAVRIGNDVEIGANTCIDRGALDDTVIDDGVKLDNLIQIGHNVHVGRHTAMAGCVGVAGSARIGAHCTVGGGAVVLGHLRLADHVHISAASVVTRSILQPGQYTGMFPIDNNASWEKNAASLKQLSRLRERIKALEASIQNNKEPQP